MTDAPVVTTNHNELEDSSTKQGDAIIAEAQARLWAIATEQTNNKNRNASQLNQTLSLLDLARATWRNKDNNGKSQGRELQLILQQEQTQARVAQALLPIGQLLANAAVELAACRPLLNVDPQSVEIGLQSLEKELRSGLEEYRWLLSDLQSPPLLNDLGLLASIKRYAQRFGDRFSIAVTINSPEDLPRLPATVELTVFRIIQEALRNVAHHAKATRVIIDIIPQEEKLWVFQVSDNGRGFVPLELLEVSGLVDVQAWAEILSASLQITSAPGQGTTLNMQLPVNFE